MITARFALIYDIGDPSKDQPLAVVSLDEVAQPNEFLNLEGTLYQVQERRWSLTRQAGVWRQMVNVRMVLIRAPRPSPSPTPPVP